MVVPRLPLPAQTSFDAGTAPPAGPGRWPADGEAVSRRPPPAVPWIFGVSTPSRPETPASAASHAPGPLAAGTRGGCGPTRAAAEPTPVPAAEAEGPWGAARRPPPVPATRAAPADNNASTRCPRHGPPRQPSAGRPRLPGPPPPVVGRTSAPHGPGPNTATASCWCRGSDGQPAHRSWPADGSGAGRLARWNCAGSRPVPLLCPRSRGAYSCSCGTSWRNGVRGRPRVVAQLTARAVRRLGHTLQVQARPAGRERRRTSRLPGARPRRAVGTHRRRQRLGQQRHR